MKRILTIFLIFKLWVPVWGLSLLGGISHLVQDAHSLFGHHHSEGDDEDFVRGLREGFSRSDQQTDSQLPDHTHSMELGLFLVNIALVPLTREWSLWVPLGEAKRAEFFYRGIVSFVSNRCLLRPPIL